jgi:basic amino acid/polyamine antiporter, APA family
VAEHLAYARKASGLVRGLSLFDAFGVAVTNQAPLGSIGIAITLGLGVFLGGNLIIAAVLSFVLAGVGFTAVWGVLGGSMPRSGGPYVYNSRVLHPVIGVAQSFGDVLIWLWWIGTLAPLAIDPGLVQLLSFLDPGIDTSWVQTDLGLFVGASVVNLLGFAFVVFGLRVFARAQRIVLIICLGGVIALGVVFAFTSRADFVWHWNTMAAQYDSLDYQSFAAAVDKASGGIPTHWNWPDTLGIMLAMSWLFAYGYSVSFVGGEVKRPQANMVWSQFLAILVPFAFMVWIGLELYHSVGFEFLSATAWYDHAIDQGTTLPGYAMPWRPNVYGLAAMVDRSWPVSLLVGVGFILVNVWWVALSYLAVPRTLFAWGMDRMGPKWFTDINPRFASPVKNHLLCLVFGEALIFMYTFVNRDSMQNIILTGFEITSVFAVTAVAALLFPYRRRAAKVWASSPYRRRRFVGLPLVVWGAGFNLAYLGILMYVMVVMKASASFQWFSVAMFTGAWVLGGAWYLFWSRRLRAEGVDHESTYDRLPPE